MPTKPGPAGKRRLTRSHPLGPLEDCLVALERARLPVPSIAVASGRGLALLWLHGPVPRKALPRWNACQKHLWQVLKPLGADRAALDAARLLRLVGTRNSKNGVIVEALTPPGEVWAFDDLANEILPYSREEIAGVPATASEGVHTLWEARLTDLQTLRRIRWFGGTFGSLSSRWL